MNLRRLVDHARPLEWRSIGIELAIVIVGVFLGMQVSNWNVEREARQRGALFAERLKADLREEAWDYQLQIEYSRDVLASAERAVNALSGRSTESNEALLVNAYRATQYKQKARRRATYDELVSTGTLGLIKSQTLRNTALQVYNFPTLENVANEGLRSRYREAFRMTLPNDVQRALGRNCGDRFVRAGDYQGLANLIDYPCRTGLPEDVIDAAARTLRANEALVPLLRLRIADIETRLVDLTGNNRDVLQGLQAIANDQP
jgi:phage baseplate assembly protein W